MNPLDFWQAAYLVALNKDLNPAEARLIADKALKHFQITAENTLWKDVE